MTQITMSRCQATFSSQIKEPIVVFEEIGNPFIEDSHYTFLIDSKDTMSEEVIKTAMKVTSLGQQQHSYFIEERFVKREKPVSDPLLRNRLALFSNK